VIDCNRRVSTSKRQDIDGKFPAGDISMMMYGKSVSKIGEILFFWKVCMNLTSREPNGTNALRKFRNLSLIFLRQGFVPNPCMPTIQEYLP